MSQSLGFNLQMNLTQIELRSQLETVQEERYDLRNLSECGTIKKFGGWSIDPLLRRYYSYAIFLLDILL